MPKIIDHDQRRREIIAVATRIILKGGFEAATMRSIAAEAGFANGALKHYFPGKDSIIAATFESILEQLDAAVNDIDAADERGRLEAFLRTPIPQDSEQVSAGRVLLALWENAMANPELADLYRRHLENWHASIVDRLGAAHEAGVITVGAPFKPWADEYIAVVTGGMVVNLMYPDGDRIGDFNAYLDGLLVRLGARAR